MKFHREREKQVEMCTRSIAMLVAEKQIENVKKNIF